MQKYWSFIKHEKRIDWLSCKNNLAVRCKQCHLLKTVNHYKETLKMVVGDSYPFEKTPFRQSPKVSMKLVEGVQYLIVSMGLEILKSIQTWI